MIFNIMSILSIIFFITLAMLAIIMVVGLLSYHEYHHGDSVMGQSLTVGFCVILGFIIVKILYDSKIL